MRSLAPIVAAILAASCSPPAPVQPPQPAREIAPAPVAPASTASAAPALAPRAQVVDTVGDIVVAAYPPTGFEALSPKHRVLAYHLAAAAWAGDGILTLQSSRYAAPIREVVARLHAGRAKLEPGFAAKLDEYRRRLALHHGIHDAMTSQKFLPSFSRAELQVAAKTLNVSISDELYAAMFDPKVAPVAINKSPGKGKDPLAESAANHYEGLTSKDLERFKEKYELNGRLVKKDGKILEQVYRAGGGGVAPGLGAAELGRVVEHLEAAAALADGVQKEALQKLAGYLRTGEPALFREHDVAWLKQVFPVDYILGFIETYTDVREKKGNFEGFVAIPDPDRDPPLQALAHSAQYFEQKLPWDDAFKRSSFRVPAAAAVTVLAATGDAGPFTFLGVNLPNAQDIRQAHGSKNFVVLSVGDTREELVGNKTIEEFAPAESRAEIHRCSRWLEYAATGFHEVTGHGSGTVSPTLKGDPSELLAPFYSTLEEGRAELVADYLSGDPKTVQIGLLPDAGCAKVFPQYKTTLASLRVKWVTNGDVAEEDHLRADLLALGWFKDRGVVSVEQRDEGGKRKTFWVVKDPQAWRAAAGELLAEHQRIKATADKPAIKELVEKYATRIDIKWRDEVLERLKALSLPRVIAMLPPTITPVIENGKIVDAKAEQTKSLDAYLDLLAAASRP